MDANEYALQVTPADKSLGIAIRNAVWLGKGNSPVTTSVGAVPPCPPEKEGAAKRAKNRSDSEAPFRKGGLGDFDSSSAPHAETKSPKPFEKGSPSSPKGEAIKVDIKPNEITIPIGDRRWRIRGLDKITSR